MRKSLFLFSVCLALVLAGCSRSEPKETIRIVQPAPVKGQNSAEAWEIRYDSWATDADRDLTREIRQALVEDPDNKAESTVALAESIAIDANNGAVTLRGSGAYTLTAEEWQIVGRRVKAVKGVKSVEVQSRVAPGE
ncbi:MAG TPA: BON domain-containing protein [Acidobacteriota bacterium]|jgi:osmotically-inducible protein OsmY|nr:BON domain-containing protein [Acidobacteriota bacterium]